MARRILLLALVATLGCNRTPAPPPEGAPPPRAAAPGLPGGVVYLLRHQSEDGAWRSDVYATFKDGTALTPLALCSLQDADLLESRDARRKASEWLAKRVKPDGTIDEGPDGLPYPVYTAALSVTALSHPENRDLLKQRDAWLKYLLDRQLTEQNGWSPEDKQYGGWGYFPGIPRKPKPGEAVPAQQLLESNLSATRFALKAIDVVIDPRIGESPIPVNHLAGASLTAINFVERLQNPDGGFHFIYDDPVRNKAGVVEAVNGKPLYPSYGSATADGLLAMRPILGACKLEGMAQRSEAARWLAMNFRAETHPGNYISARESSRNAVYFYYTAAVAKVLRHVWSSEAGEKASQLARALTEKQRPDGSWSNPLDQQRENDPILATAYAVSALAECRKARAK